MIKINKNTRTVTVTTIKEFKSILTKSKYYSHIIFEPKKVKNEIINIDVLISVGRYVGLIEINYDGDIFIEDLLLGESSGELKIKCKRLYIRSIMASARFCMNFDINADVVLECGLNEKVFSLGTDDLIATLNLVNSLNLNNNIIDSIIIDPIDRLIKKLSEKKLGQYAIDRCTSVAIPSSELPINENNEIILYKRCKDDLIVKLRVPIKDDNIVIFLKRNELRKIRVAYAIVDSIYEKKSAITTKPSKRKTARSVFDSSFIYKVGNVVKPKKMFDPTMHSNCASGIHGFLNIRSALDYSP